nr:hypothetical protein [Tanacetum cinerariifolium]
NTSQISSIHSVAPIQSTKESERLLSMGYEHLSITPETESDEVTKSNAENLLPIPIITTFSNPLFKDNDDLDSSNDESLPDEDVLAEEFKIYSNSLFDEDEINSDKLDPHCFNVESDFVESLLNRVSESASWVWGTGSHGVLGKGLGRVLVRRGCTVTAVGDEGYTGNFGGKVRWVC